MEQKEHVAIETELVDIMSVVVDQNLPKKERILEFLRQIRNPYHFRCGDMVIHVSYNENGRSLEDCIKSVMMMSLGL